MGVLSVFGSVGNWGAIEVLGVFVPVEGQLVGQVQAVLGHVRRPLRGAEDALAGADAAGLGAIESFVRLLDVDLVRGKQDLVGPLLDQGRCELVQPRAVTVVGVLGGVLEADDMRMGDQHDGHAPVVPQGVEALEELAPV